MKRSFLNSILKSGILIPIVLSPCTIISSCGKSPIVEKGVKVTGPTTIEIGKTAQYIAETTNDNEEFNWIVESGTGAATISSSGVVTPISIGTIKVKAELKSDVTKYGSIEVTICNSDPTKEGLFNIQDGICYGFKKGITQEQINKIYNTENFDLPKSIISVADNAFDRNNSQNTTKIPSNITKITFGSDFIQIGKNAFANNSLINKIDFSYCEYPTYINENSFKNINGSGQIITWTGEQSAYLYPNLIKAGLNFEKWSFSVTPTCKDILKLDINENQVGCAGFKDWVEKETISYVCNGVLTIPEGVTNIGESAFYSDGGISNIPHDVKTLVLPSTITDIDSYAFKGWDWLDYLNLKAVNNIPNWTGANIFSSTSNSGLVYFANLSDDKKIEFLDLLYEKGLTNVGNWLILPVIEEGPTRIYALEDSTLALYNANGNQPDLKYSTDLTTWNDYSQPIQLEAGSKIYLKGTNPNGWSKSFEQYSTLVMTGQVAVLGNVMSLIDGDSIDFDYTTSIPNNCCFAFLFNSKLNNITYVSEDFLPATTLTMGCYEGMFANCQSLIEAPKLPATILQNNCYKEMFKGCTQLASAPVLTADICAESCYEGMFSGCSNITEFGSLQATTLAKNCYKSMFSDCSGLKKAPAELPANICTESCYEEMFKNCSALIQVPKLLAKDLADRCYYGMFNGCSSLTKAPELPATTMKFRCYDNMFCGCRKLETPPNLPATVLAEACYAGMFQASGLTTAPALPAITLEPYCYELMFNSTKISEIPNLPALEMKDYCYSDMFCSCDNLTKIKNLPATTLAPHCYDCMFQNCHSLESCEIAATELATGSLRAMFFQCKHMKSVTVHFTDWGDDTKGWMNGQEDFGIFYCPSALPERYGEDYIPEDWMVVRQ